jgi:hypothetical protein
VVSCWLVVYFDIEGRNLVPVNGTSNLIFWISLISCKRLQDLLLAFILFLRFLNSDDVDKELCEDIYPVTCMCEAGRDLD